MKLPGYKYIPSFKGLQKAFVITVCEGDGTGESPKRWVYYVYDEYLNKLGEIDTLSQNQTHTGEEAKE